MANLGYYLPLAPTVFESIHFLGIEARTEGIGEARTQKHAPDGNPVWTLTLLIQRPGSIPEVETFAWTATTQAATTVGNLAPMTPVTLVGLEGGKWSKASTDRTTWSFRVGGIEPVKR